jgi:hypothetical protein
MLAAGCPGWKGLVDPSLFTVTPRNSCCTANAIVLHSWPFARPTETHSVTVPRTIVWQNFCAEDALLLVVVLFPLTALLITPIMISAMSTPAMVVMVM